MIPRYPIYIPSKARYDTPWTINTLQSNNVPFKIVVEPQEHAEYAKRFGDDLLLTLPQNDRGLIYARNWIKEHSVGEGAERHWQLDDNIKYFARMYRGKRIVCEAGVALAVIEDFVDRYENIAIAGPNYRFFVMSSSESPPFHLNSRVYSCTLVLNSLPFKWRTRYNDDTDICLQALSAGWCTVSVNVFLIEKVRTMRAKGGNTPIYQGDGRLKMARSLERLWPGVVKTGRRFQRPQHVVKNQWRLFDTPLKLKPGIDLTNAAPDEYGMRVVQVKPTIKSERIRALLDQP